jgi:hypothetical protein
MILLTEIRQTSGLMEIPAITAGMAVTRAYSKVVITV